jgi:uncharacterized protein YchJ
MDRILSLFQDLQPLALQTPGKPDPHENLTDILEIVAVAAGIRPAHLQGQGQHDEERLAFVERTARRHDLMTLRTRGLIPFLHRPRRYEHRIIEFQEADHEKKQREGPEVLWVHADEKAATAIPNIVAGRASVSDALAYPNCCVIHDSEHKVALAEAYVKGIVDTYHPGTSDEVVELWQRNVQVQIAVDPDADIPQTEASLKRFPYVQFTACPACFKDNSPAAQTNHRMRDLAFELSPAFGRRIWQARDLVINKGRPIPVGRNAACPCGRGSKFKKCCGRIEST